MTPPLPPPLLASSGFFESVMVVNIWVFELRVHCQTVCTSSSRLETASASGACSVVLAAVYRHSLSLQNWECLGSVPMFLRRSRARRVLNVVGVEA